MMWFRPELVDMTRLPLEERPESSTSRSQGIGGKDPRGNASAKMGRDGVNVLVKNAVPKILELLESKRTVDPESSSG